MKVTFVCGGNTCRSPMAEYLFRDLSEKAGLDIEVVSRGLSKTYVGKGASRVDLDGILEPSQQALLDYNPNFTDLDSFESTVLSSTDIETSDLVLTMEYSHRDSIIREIQRGRLKVSPSQTEKIFALKEYVGVEGELWKSGYYDIKDPITMLRIRKLAFEYMDRQKKAREKKKPHTFSWNQVRTRIFERTPAQEPKTTPLKKDDNSENPYAWSKEKRTQVEYTMCRDEILGYLEALVEKLK